MILMDLSNILYSCARAQMSVSKSKELDEKFFKHYIFSSIKKYRKKFKKEYGELIIVCDSKNGYWRKDIFPHYKASRKTSRDTDDFDWDQIFGIFNNVKDDLKEFFPYIVLDVDKAEADDVIAIMVKNYYSEENNIILSSDQDNIQLQLYRGTKQFSMLKDVYVTDDNPDFQLFEKIVKGDGSDGIPSILSKEDHFVNPDSPRQKSITKKNLAEWYEIRDPKKWCETKEILERFQKNRKIIDYRCIPKDLEATALKQFESFDQEILNKRRSKLFGYLAKNKLVNLLENLDEF